MNNITITFTLILTTVTMKFTHLYTKATVLLLSAGVICSGVIMVNAKTLSKANSSVDELIGQASTSTEKNDFPSLTKNLSH